MKIKGFYFELSEILDDNKILLKIKNTKITATQFSTYCDWFSENEMFCSNVMNISDVFSQIKIRNDLPSLVWDFNSINDNGIIFLECLTSCKSVDEFRLKLQILGYDF